MLWTKRDWTKRNGQKGMGKKHWTKGIGRIELDQLSGHHFITI